MPCHKQELKIPKSSGVGRKKIGVCKPAYALMASEEVAEQLGADNSVPVNDTSVEYVLTDDVSVDAVVAAPEDIYAASSFDLDGSTYAAEIQYNQFPSVSDYNGAGLGVVFIDANNNVVAQKEALLHIQTGSAEVITDFNVGPVSVASPTDTAVLFYVDSTANTLAINVNNGGVLTSPDYDIPATAVKASFYIWIEDNQTSLVGEVVDVNLALVDGLVNTVEEGTKNVLGGLF